MPDYQKMYLTLFNGVTDAVERLQRAQLEAEELYLQANDPIRLEPRAPGPSPTTE